MFVSDPGHGAMTLERMVFVASVAVLGGCGGGDGGGASNQFCHTIPVHSITCNSCTQVSNTGAAFDGNFESSADMTAGGQGTFDAKTATQVGGSIAGVFFVPPSPQDTSITITTLKGGTIQDQQTAPATRSGATDQCSNAGPPGVECTWHDGQGSFVGIDTTKDYDEIQVTVGNSAVGTLHVNEVCVR